MKTAKNENDTSVSNHVEREVAPLLGETVNDGHLSKISAPKRRKYKEQKTTDFVHSESLLEEDEDTSKEYRNRLRVPTLKSRVLYVLRIPIVNKLISLLMSISVLLLLKKLVRPSVLQNFLIWMEAHPMRGLVAYMIVYPLHMVILVPSTPLVMGAGFVFKVQYGWMAGVSFCSVVTLFGSLMGSIVCFLLARYCIRSRVRRWSKRYPMFDPIDEAVSENGFKIMSLLYLTPVMPLGPVSYMMGTTSMPLVEFAKSKIFALPLTVLYVYMGAATGTLMTATNEEEQIGAMQSKPEEALSSQIHEMSLSPKAMIFGIMFSVVSIALISYRMKMELEKIIHKNTEEPVDEEQQLSSDSQTKNKKVQVNYI